MLNSIWGPNYELRYGVWRLRSFDTEPSHSQPDDILFLCSRPLRGGNITRTIRGRLSIRELLLQDDGHCLSSLLMYMNVPVETQERVLQEISEVARSAGTSPISIGVTFFESDGYATKSSIEALEKVTLQQDELDSVAACVICTQEFEAGLEVTRMPCSHVYHEQCIVKWLKRSNVCPLCRYSMPHRF